MSPSGDRLEALLPVSMLVHSGGKFGLREGRWEGILLCSCSTFILCLFLSLSLAELKAEVESNCVSMLQLVEVFIARARTAPYTECNWG